MAEVKVVAVDFPDELFNVQSNVSLMHQVVVAQLAAARQGTHKVKTRAEVSGSGRKPFKQKGTGNARQGSIRAPHMTGGGVVHGPVPRTYSQRTPKKMKAAALRGALSDRLRHGRITVVESLVLGARPKTKEALQTILSVTDRRNVLVVADNADNKTIRSVRNIENVQVLRSGQLNTYDVLIAEDIIFTKQAFEEFVKNASGTKKSNSSDGASATSKVVKAEDKESSLASKGYKGSKSPLKDPLKAPKGYEIKAVRSSKVYYSPESKKYASVTADLCFNNAENAEAAGFSAAEAKSVTDKKGKA